MKKYTIIIMDTLHYRKLSKVVVYKQSRIEAMDDVKRINSQFKLDPRNTHAAMLI